MKKVIIALLGVFGLITSNTLFAEQEQPSDQAQGEYRYYGSELCRYPEFTCVKVSQGSTWEKLFPNEREREIVKRLNRTNLPLSYRRWIVVPTHLSEINHLDLSPFPAEIKATGKKLIVVNLGLHAFAAYGEQGQLVHWGPASGGKGWCPDVKSVCNTAIGVFRVAQKEGPKCISKIFPVQTNGGARMPWCMYYYRGFALHGSSLPGFHASHGCIRLFTDDAQWLNQHFVDIGTQVIVTR